MTDDPNAESHKNLERSPKSRVVHLAYVGKR